MNLNFALILLVLSVVTGFFWCWDRLSLRKKRLVKTTLALKEFDDGAALSIRATGGDTAVEVARKELIKKCSKMPWWLDYSVNFFPVIFAVFMLRSFLFEPFRIPSGSMIPTLQVGDMILVNKFTYGIRLPVINKKIVDMNQPQRGDVMVFRYPIDPSIDYIKRVIAVPGDKIAYENKRVSINGTLLGDTATERYLVEDIGRYFDSYIEENHGRSYRVIVNPYASGTVHPIAKFAHFESCTYTRERVECVVPEGHFFMMGDNRDNSEDSRYWGFVPEENIVGKAFFVWMNFSDFKRIGSIH